MAAGTTSGTSRGIAAHIQAFYLDGISVDKKVELNVNLPAQLVEKIADTIGKQEGFVAIISNAEGFVTISCNEKSGQNALELLKSLGAKGGGSAKYARGKITA